MSKVRVNSITAALNEFFFRGLLSVSDAFLFCILFPDVLPVSIVMTRIVGGADCLSHTYVLRTSFLQGMEVYPPSMVMDHSC